jgi:hypothetical protein
MAIPRVFISSTCYDLRYIRENLKFFIKNMGFEPVLSEEGSVYYDPTKHVQDACLAEVPNCQMFVLIIGGRFGSKFKDKAESIVNYEYREAVNDKIPVFAMVEQQVHAEYRVYLKNKENKNIDASKITYPGVDSTKVFAFMEEVESKAVNNALVPFSDFNELESYLKQQWAGLMFSFLTKKAEAERVTNMLETLATMSNRIEFLSKQILSSVGKDIEKINALLYEPMSKSELIKLATYLERKPSPTDYIKNDTLNEILDSLGLISQKLPNSTKLIDKATGKEMINVIGDYYPVMERDYVKTREKMIEILAENGLKPDDFLEAIKERETIAKK